MGADFRHIFASIGMRGFEERYDDAVEQIVRVSAERSVTRSSVFNGLVRPEGLSDNRLRVWTREPYDTDPSAPVGSRHGNDGVIGGIEFV